MNTKERVSQKMKNELIKGEFYIICTHSSDEPIFGKVLAVSAYGVKVDGYRLRTTDVPSRWVSFGSIVSVTKARSFYNN